MSKLLEKAVCVQLTDYITSNNLSETFQSAYKSFHSTETALLKVQSDILCALDCNESVIHVHVLVLLDLSAAFDTVPGGPYSSNDKAVYLFWYSRNCA